MLKLLFNIAVIYLIWQSFRMMFIVRKTQNKFQERMNDLSDKFNKSERKINKRKSRDQDGEYIDYEEIK